MKGITKLKILTLIYMIAFSVAIGVVINVAIIAVVALFNGGVVQLNFNQYGENLLEAIIIPISTILCIIALFTFKRNPWSCEK